MSLSYKNDDIDFHEYQKSIIGTSAENSDINLVSYNKETKTIDSNAKINSIVDVKKDFNVENLFNKKNKDISNYLFLSNTNQVNDNKDPYVLKYNIKEQIPQIKTGIINTNNAMENIVKMQISNISFYNSVVFDPEFDNPMYYGGGRMAVLIEEFASQSYIQQNGSRFHFIVEFNSPEVIFWTPPDPPVKLLETYSPYYQNYGFFNFRMPFTKVDTLTFRFYDPFYPIDLSNYSSFMFELRLFTTPSVDYDILE